MDALVTALLANGSVVDLAIAWILVEIAVLALRRPAGLRTALPNLCAGLGLALALRAAVTDAGGQWVLLFMAAAGVAHAWEMLARERAARAASEAPVDPLPRRPAVPGAAPQRGRLRL
jgi:tetrahydromethanopterin S-methyltransferase subunit D